MIWIIFWLIIGTMWSWQALLEYRALNKGFMSTNWQVFNILLNTLFLPFGLIFGTFIYLVGKKIVQGDQEMVDFDFTALRIMTHYNKDFKSDKKDKNIT